ncbi:DHHA1 domain protein [Candidatus Anstonella stagnisolia]|nr:DHHA1 domain protein [Candidatus Anstonella stagnisolia]
MEPDLPAFLERCAQIREHILQMKNPHILSHFDCDGLASASITTAFLTQHNIPHTLQIVKKLDAAALSSLSGKKEIIFTDLGSGCREISNLHGDIVVLDHHQRAGIPHLEANPYLFGFNGDTHISASGVCYFVFKTHVHLGIVGAVGDVQTPLSSPESLNCLMLQDAENSNAVKKYTGIRLFGRASRPLSQMLFFADDPYLPGLSGDEQRCSQFLSTCNIPLKEGERWRTYLDLTQSEQAALISALAEFLSKDGSPTKPQQLLSENYLLLSQPKGSELSDAGEFSTLLNACGRNNRPQTGIGVCLGEAGAVQEALSLLALHRKNLRAGIEYAQANLLDFGKFFLLDGRGIIPDGIIGVVAGMLVGRGQKPILALALDSDSKNTLKLSTRATKSLVESGLNLGKILNETTPLLGGVGGGHKIAAGASIPNEKLEEFLLLFAEKLQ